MILIYELSTIAMILMVRPIYFIIFSQDLFVVLKYNRYMYSSFIINLKKVYGTVKNPKVPVS